MRVRKQKDGLTAMAVAGAYVVLIGWDMSEAQMRSLGVLGFSIQRRRHSDGEVIWLNGMKTFEAVDPDPDLGVPVSSFIHPMQTFQWSDYTASPGETYSYRLVTRAGQPGALTEGPEVTLKVTTERTDIGKHSVFFNRGAVASQEYARRFQNQKPEVFGQSAFNWLSRGLVEGLEAFIGQAQAGDELYGAFFEFKNKRIYDAIKAAKERGVPIKILYDGDSQREGNEEALQGSGIKALTKARTRSGGFAHNKFLVLVRQNGKHEVWTGSTNLSENGIFGHSNNAHIVRDATIADQYRQAWDVLFDDKTKKPTAQANELNNPSPPNPWNEETIAIFSPRTTLDVLDWYASLSGGAKRGLFTTFAFGMNSRFVTVYENQAAGADKVLRFALMEKKGNGRTFVQQSKEIDQLRKLGNVVVSVGNKVVLNTFDRWLAEIDQIVDEAHVLYVHTKYMLIDPLGDDPIVIVGSANFSAASTETNDENMLVIRGNKSVADVYMGEFMRLFSHYAFRESLKFKGVTSPAAALRRKYLIDSVEWIAGEGPSSSYFAPKTDRTLRRLYFSGQ